MSLKLKVFLHLFINVSKHNKSTATFKKPPKPPQTKTNSPPNLNCCEIIPTGLVLYVKKDELFFPYKTNFLGFLIVENIQQKIHHKRKLPATRQNCR